MKQALQIAIDYMNDRLEDHDCKYQRHPATEAERINILADIETVKEALAKQEGQSNFCLQCEALARELKAAKQEQGEPVALEPAPKNSLPTFKECRRIITNHEFRERAKAGLEGRVLDSARTTPIPTALHHFIYEYDDADPYKSSWFMHRLECVLKESTTPQPALQGVPVACANGCSKFFSYTTPQQRKPLTRAEIINAVATEFNFNSRDYDEIIEPVTRAIEAAHGITAIEAEDSARSKK